MISAQAARRRAAALADHPPLLCFRGWMREASTAIPHPSVCQATR
jgi:hypothetical protein